MDNCTDWRPISARSALESSSATANRSSSRTRSTACTASRESLSAAQSFSVLGVCILARAAASRIARREKIGVATTAAKSATRNPIPKKKADSINLAYPKSTACDIFAQGHAAAKREGRWSGFRSSGQTLLVRTATGSGPRRERMSAVATLGPDRRRLAVSGIRAPNRQSSRIFAPSRRCPKQRTLRCGDGLPPFRRRAVFQNDREQRRRQRVTPHHPPLCPIPSSDQIGDRRQLNLQQLGRISARSLWFAALRRAAALKTLRFEDRHASGWPEQPMPPEPGVL